jgi:hypothetical protein
MLYAVHQRVQCKSNGARAPEEQIRKLNSESFDTLNNSLFYEIIS